METQARKSSAHAMEYLESGLMKCGSCLIKAINLACGVRSDLSFEVYGAPHVPGICFACAFAFTDGETFSRLMKELLPDDTLAFFTLTIFTSDPHNVVTEFINQIPESGVMNKIEVMKHYRNPKACRLCGLSILEISTSICPKCAKVLDIAKSGTFVSALSTGSVILDSIMTLLISAMTKAKFEYLNIHSAYGIIANGVIIGRNETCH